MNFLFENIFIGTIFCDYSINKKRNEIHEYIKTARICEYRRHPDVQQLLAKNTSSAGDTGRLQICDVFNRVG